MTPITRRRLSRRMLLTDFGAAGLGVVILGACGSSSSDSATTAARPGTDPPSTDPRATDPPATDAPATDPPATDPPATDAPVVTDPPATDAPTTTEAASSSLRFQHVDLGFVSAFVLLRGNEAAIVDTGVPGSAPSLLAGLSALGADWSNVRHIVLTHLHGDHIGSLPDALVEASSATVYAGEGDLAQIQPISPAPIQAVGDGDEVLGLGVLNTPGHTPGSISLFDTETGLLVAGDAITGDGAAGTIAGPAPQFTPDMTTALASVAKLAALNAEIAAFGHVGPPVTTDVAAQIAAIPTG